MAIGTITLGTGAGLKPSAPLAVQPMSFPGDASYPTGGTATFGATVKTKLGKSCEILQVIGGDCGVYLALYDKGNDKLKVRKIVDGTEPTATTDLSGTTFNVTVLYA